jgi:hypothetical protein
MSTIVSSGTHTILGQFAGPGGAIRARCTHAEHRRVPSSLVMMLSSLHGLELMLHVQPTPVDEEDCFPTWDGCGGLSYLGLADMWQEVLKA